MIEVARGTDPAAPAEIVAVHQLRHDSDPAPLQTEDPAAAGCFQRVAQILAHAAQVSFVAVVILKERGDDLAVGAQRALAVHQVGQHLLGFAVPEADGDSVQINLEIAEGADPHPLPVLNRAAQIVQLFFYLFGGDGLCQIAAGMEIEGRVPVMAITGGKNNVDVRVIQLQPFRQFHAVHGRHFHIEKRHIHVIFFCEVQCVFRIPETVDDGLGRGQLNGFHQILQSETLVIYRNDDH